jgi:hypothetical protein
MEETVTECSEIIIQFEMSVFKIIFSEISLLCFAVQLTHSLTFTTRWQFYVAAKIGGNLSYRFRNQKCWLLQSYLVDFGIIRIKEGIPTLY